MITAEINTFNKFDNTITTKREVIVGKKNVIADLEGVYAYSFDCAHIPFSKDYPIAVVFPETTKQVSDILKLANKYKIPVIERGAATNHAGGCAPVKGGIILHFSKMNKILEISNQDLVCRVQP